MSMLPRRDVLLVSQERDTALAEVERLRNLHATAEVEQAAAWAEAKRLRDLANEARNWLGCGDAQRADACLADATALDEKGTHA
jgi:hypothetical protein